MTSRLCAGASFRLLFLGSATVMAVLLTNSLLGDPQGVRASIVSGGIMCVVRTGVVLAFIPSFWRSDVRHKVQS